MRTREKGTCIRAILLTGTILLSSTRPVYGGQTGFMKERAPTLLYERQEKMEAETGDFTFSPEESSASTESVLTGRIRVELISVSLPAGGVDFSVNPEAPFQLESPGEQFQDLYIPVANHSVVPVRVEISSMPDIRPDDVKFSEKFSGQEQQSFSLVDKISRVGPPGTAILVMGVEGQTFGSAAEFEHQAIQPGKQNIFVTDIPAEETRNLKLYGKIAPDFYGKYQFTIRPMLKISAVQAESG